MHARTIFLPLAALVAAAVIATALFWPGGSASAGPMMGKTGDTNGDGVTNSLDALQVLFYDAGMLQGIEGMQFPDPWMTAADVNCDMAVNSLDASMILQANAGLINLRP